MVAVREITTDDWAALREVRLAALAEAPYAFGSSYAGEAGLTEESWRSRIRERPVTFFADAEQGDTAARPVGVAAVLVEDGQPELVSIWVRPSARGQGAGEALVEEAASWAKARGHPVLSLWVTETNRPARWLYERLGFAATGERQPLPSDASLAEIRMSRPL